MDQRVSFFEQLRDFFSRNMTWFLLAALVLLALQDIFGTHVVLAMRHSQNQAAEIRKEINRLNQENGQLQDSVKALKSDPASIERIAREEMGLARPGEYIFKVSPKPGDSSPQPSQPAESRKSP